MEWTKKQIRLLEKFYFDEGEKYLSFLLKKSQNAIRIKAFRLNLRKLNSRKNIKLSPAENQIILGSLLGDMYCRLKGNCINAQIEEAHCKKQEPYLLWKVTELKSFSFNLRRTNLGYLHFESRAYPILNDYLSLFYRDKKKIITKVILKKLDKLGLAVWYMDDGFYSKKGNYCNLYTNGFTYKENLIIKKWFEKTWGIFPQIKLHREIKRYPGKIWYFLNFNVNESKKLIAFVRNYIHPVMEYKIGVYN